MKKFLGLLTLLIISVWVGLQIHNDPGYALFAYKNWTVEMPLWFTLVVMIVSWIVGSALVSLISNASSLRGRLRSWRGRRKLRLSRRLTSQGFIELAEGHWALAEKYLIRAVKRSELPLLNYLSAARAAQEQGAYERRDEYLRLAQESTPDARVAVGVVQAELQLSHDQLEHAVATLRHLREIVPDHPYVLQLLMQVYRKLGDWTSLTELLPVLRKYRVVTFEESQTLQLQIYTQGLQSVVKHTDLETLHQFWRQVPREMQRHPSLLRLYVQALIEKGGGREAENYLREMLKRNWSEDLVLLYGVAESEDPAKQLHIAESWLKVEGNSPGLLLTLGRLCMRNQLWGKARSYFESSLQLHPRIDTYWELAQLLDQLGDHDAATRYFRQGLQKAVGNSAQETRLAKCYI